MSSRRTPSIQRAISVRQPFAELILRGSKTIEYRSRRTTLRERVYIYASQTPSEEAVFEQAGMRVDELLTGVIVGSVEIINCTGEDGNYEWHLARPKRVKKSLEPKNHPQPSIWRPQF